MNSRNNNQPDKQGSVKFNQLLQNFIPKGTHMIKILRFTPVNKGSLVGYFDIEIEKWGGFQIFGCAYMVKDKQRWINFPQKEGKPADDGKKTFFSHCRFADRKMMDSFQEKVIEALAKIESARPQTQQQLLDEEPVPF